MKELSTEEKAKAYDEAIERAKKLQKTCDSTAVVGWCEYIFPQLKESEDEKIRKALLRWVQSNSYTSIAGVPIKNVIAWFEKQGEHKRFRDSIQVGDNVTKNEYDELVNLSQLKRVAKRDTYILEKQGKQKPTWSKEDEEMLKEIISDVKFEGYNNDLLANSYKKINWLKNIKQRYTWKPSNEQMKALDNFIFAKYPNIEKYEELVKSLYQDLKKLNR